MALAESIVTQLRRLESTLNQALLRLHDITDAEALHDVRINLQRIRSLLRPLRGIPDVTQLSRAAAELGKITTPIRDLEVLIAELEQHPLAWQTNTRKTELHSRKLALMSQPLLTHFPTLLHAWPKTFRRTNPRHTKRRIALRLSLQTKQLCLAMADSHYDRHRLRLLVKRLRYVVDAYPQLSPITPEAAANLKTAQSALGDWHDRFVWCQQAENQQDLWPLLPEWQRALDVAQAKAEKALFSLSRVLNA
ncbi:CHAD domain-containing protein [Serratia liquefaciens]|uniref:CHAD domain-containing protein n=1 Tax=Serratia liquefaciens TaxID=614 RepID=UPI0022DD793C|nr:CHAD domain-containing protein [Serratia liquefaciens]WBL70520.1 CHAD domain-containing protein [Serratia liquefaciens]